MSRVRKAVSAAVVGAIIGVSVIGCSSESTFEYFTSKAQATAFIESGKLPEQLPDNARDIRVLANPRVHVATWHGDTIVDPSCVPGESQPPKGNRIVLESQTIVEVYQCSFGFQGRDGGSIYWWPAE
ncbi:hypothetical protein [Okibacterium fritillariae]|uniref:Lipoprotein n=1 Tax=Okibacterium fritillariae TaxID=123320 RepID=A0A1T5IUP0_9MICO|nr:hypothetical protein [Okibacterium fritillariae]SKC42782.1 hypothetical protein SAMN06309945_0864 [Okibacterium fritillariae]